MLYRQDSESMESQMQLQAEVDRWQQESSQLSTALREAQAGREQAEVHLERLQGSLRDLQRHNQDRGNYDELQTRFKEVSRCLCIALPSRRHLLVLTHRTVKSPSCPLCSAQCLYLCPDRC